MMLIEHWVVICTLTNVYYLNVRNVNEKDGELSEGISVVIKECVFEYVMIWPERWVWVAIHEARSSVCV